MLPRMLEHMIWADERTMRSLESLAAPDHDAVHRYAHILGAEAVWLQRIGGVPATISPFPELDLAGCAELARSNHAWIRRIVAELSPAFLSRAVSYTNSRGESYTNNVDDILHHVCMHGMYHRGQVVLRVREAGGTPLATDFIAFVREAGTAS